MLTSSLIKTGLLYILVFSCLSCLGPREYVSPSYFDLGRPVAKDIKLNINSIVQEGPYRSRMIIRTASGSVKLDEYQRWTQSPDLMLTHYLKQSFKPGGEFNLEGEIISFENDQAKGKAVFTFHYTINKMSNKVLTGSFIQERDCDESPEAFSKAMGQMASELAEELTKKLSTLK